MYFLYKIYDNSQLSKVVFREVLNILTCKTLCTIFFMQSNFSSVTKL